MFASPQPACVRLDLERASRTGEAEVVFGQGKTPQQVVELLQRIQRDGGSGVAMATRLDESTQAAIREHLPEAVLDEQTRCAVLGELPPPRGDVVVVSAGTTDAAVAAEAALTARVHGAQVERINDCGVAGLHRILAVRERLARADVVIVVAGMDGALPSVVAGLVSCPVIAVPTSVGYGAAFDGLAALLSMLNACAPGVSVCNIDNGFGAGVAAARIVRRSPYCVGKHSVVISAKSQHILSPLRAQTLQEPGAMTTAWLDCSAGASGDMLLGALVDAGAPLDAIQQAVDAVAPEQVRLSVQETTRGGLAASHVQVHAPHSHEHRTWGTIRALLDDADLPQAVREQAQRAFELLAHAEGKAHRIEPEQVHFHEVGALDAIADVVGVCAGLHALGVTEVLAGPVALGSGTVHAAHGVMPVPVPAVMHLFAASDAVSYSGPAPHEMCTPTGAALLCTLVSGWGVQPPMRLHAVGVGAGSREVAEVPNVLRVFLGQRADSAASADEYPSDATVVLSTNIDDMDPRLWPDVLAGLLTAGASDAWLTPILMKKGRPAHTLSVLCRGALVPELRTLIFRSTTTLGLREQVVGKVAAERSYRTVEINGHPVRIKRAHWNGELVNEQPEYRDLAAAAAATGEPVAEVARAIAKL